MRWSLVLALLLTACGTSVAAQPSPTEDPRVAALTSERDALAQQVQELKAQAQTLTAQRDVALTTQLADAQSAAQHPTFVTWNTTQTIRPRHSLQGGLPDTFTARIRFTATAPVRAMVMTFEQLVRYMSTDSISGALVYPASTSLDVTFHDAEGCAGYVLVLDAEQEATVTPIISITRAPNPNPTGDCAK